MTRSLPVRQLLLWTALGLMATSPYACVPVAQRVQYWRIELPREVPLGSRAAALVSWLDAKHLKYDRDPGAHFIHFTLEEVPGDGIVCKSWHVMATASLDRTGAVMAYDVDSAGSCR